jgi:hypothetical protein
MMRTSLVLFIHIFTREQDIRCTEETTAYETCEFVILNKRVAVKSIEVIMALE